MSVDFFDCPACCNSVCDAGPYFSCVSCGTSICDSCAEKYKCGFYSDEEIEVNEGGCPYCKIILIHTDTLLSFVLGKLEIKREQLEELYRKEMLIHQ